MAHLKIDIEVTSEIIYQDGHREPGLHETHLQSIAYSYDAAEKLVNISNSIISRLHNRRKGVFGRSSVRFFTEALVDVRKNVKGKIEYTVRYYGHGQSDDGYQKTINETFKIIKPF